MKVVSCSWGPWTCSTPSLPTAGTSPIHFALLPGPESQSAYFSPSRRRRHALDLEREHEPFLAFQVEREHALRGAGGAGALEVELADRVGWPAVAVGVGEALAEGVSSPSSPPNTNSHSTTATSASTTRPISTAPPSRDEPAAMAPGTPSVAATGRVRGRGACRAAVAGAARAASLVPGAGLAPGSGTAAAFAVASASGSVVASGSAVASGCAPFAAAGAGRSGSAPPTSSSCARTVSAHARAPLLPRSIRRVAWRGLPFCWPSRKSAIWATLSAGSSTSGASAVSPAWARVRTASSEIFRSSAICP